MIAKSFLEVSQLWTESKRPIVKHTTMCAYLLIFHRQVLPTFSAHLAISEEQVQAFVLDKLASGLAKKTVRDIVAVLRSVVRYGERRGIFRDEHWQVDYPTASTTKRLPTLSLKYHKQLLSHLLEQPSVQNVGVLIALSTGMRIGEVCGLRWEDVDWTQDVLRVSRTTSRVYNCELGQTERIISSPKTVNAYREIPMSGMLKKVLQSLKRQSQSPFVVGRLLHGTEPRAYRDYFHRLLQRLGIPRIVFHGLRHTFATRCIESQCDYKTVSTILGHANVATTLNLYVHPNLAQKKRAINKLNRWMGVSHE